MNLPLRLLDLAKREAHADARWYERRQSGLGRRFLQTLYATLMSVEQRPTHYPHLETVPDDVPIRRAITKRFPYLVIFEIRCDEIVVLAVAHTRRRPNVGTMGQTSDTLRMSSAQLCDRLSFSWMTTQ